MTQKHPWTSFPKTYYRLAKGNLFGTNENVGAPGTKHTAPRSGLKVPVCSKANATGILEGWL